jgi:dihydropteroate synthase
MSFFENRTIRSGRDCGGTRIMGILNVTPDSFHDGGRHFREGAETYAIGMIGDGADIIDVGGESTRPGFVPVSAEEEIRRVVPVIRRISEMSETPISVDTVKPAVAAAAIDAGASIVNDVGGSSEEMMRLAADRGATMVITHMPRDITEIHSVTAEGDVIPQILSFFRAKTQAAEDMGIPENRIILDPGIGFGKTAEQNAEILHRTDELCGRFPVLIGASMKRFLRTAFPHMTAEDASIEAAVTAAMKGAAIVRVHDVRGTYSALRQVTK